MQLSEEWQSRRCLLLKQHQHHRKVLLLHAPTDGLVIFGDLPWAQSFLANEQNEDGCLRNLISERRQPVGPCLYALWRKVDVSIRVSAPERRFEALHEPHVLRVVAEEPAPHARTASVWFAILA